VTATRLALPALNAASEYSSQLPPVRCCDDRLNLPSVLFYLVRDAGASAPAVRTYMTLSALREDWLRHRRTSPAMSGFVHAGNPLQSLKDILPLLRARPGEVLLSEPVRWLLPPSLGEAGEAVGAVPHDAHLLTLYAARSGWGGHRRTDTHTIDTPFTPAPPEALCPHCGCDPTQVTEEPWVEALAETDPDTAARLRTRGLITAALYDTCCAALPIRDQMVVDRHRFRREAEPLDPQDPFALASVLPEWMQNLEIERMEPAVRTLNVLRREEIRVPRDLHAYTLERALEGWKNFGAVSAADLAAALTRTALNPSMEVLRYFGAEPARSLAERIEAVLDALPGGDRTVFELRFGRTGEPRTLEEVGAALGVTRERARQRESRAIQALEDARIPRDLDVRIRALLEGRTTPLFLDRLPAEDTWFAEMEGATAYLGRILTVLGDDLYVLPAGERSVVCRISPDAWSQLCTAALDQTELLAKARASRAEVEQHLRDQAAEAGAPELAPLLVAEIQDSLQYIRTPRGERLYRVGKTLTDVLSAILAESEHPLHTREVAVRYQERTGRAVPPAQINTHLQRAALRYGRGTYGLAQHFPLSEADTHDILTEVEEIVAEIAPDRQWHVVEVFDHLLDRRPDLPEELDRFVLNLVLERSDRFVPLGRMVWTRAEEDAAAPDRVEIADACVQILEEAGHPLAQAEIRERVEERRGIGRYFVVNPTDRLLKVAPGSWGLRERDIPGTYREHAALVDAVRQILPEWGIGIHSSELLDAVRSLVPVPEGFTAYMLIRLCHEHPDLSLARGQIIYLSAWGNPRRYTVAEAVRTLADQYAEPLRMEEVCTAAGRLIRRSVEPREVYGALGHCGFEYDSELARYRLVEEDELE
jgi:hypothetical protein